MAGTVRPDATVSIASAWKIAWQPGGCPKCAERVPGDSGERGRPLVAQERARIGISPPSAKALSAPIGLQKDAETRRRVGLSTKHAGAPSLQVGASALSQGRSR